jgi:hypothetical protein
MTEVHRSAVVVPVQSEGSSSGEAGSGFFSFFGRHWLMLTFGVILLVILGLFGGCVGGLLQKIGDLFRVLLKDAGLGADLLNWALQQITTCTQTQTWLCIVFEIIGAAFLGQKLGLNAVLYEILKFGCERLNIYTPSPQAEELNRAADVLAAQRGESQQETRQRENATVGDRILSERTYMEGYLKSKGVNMTVEMQRKVQRVSAAAALKRLKEKIFNDAKSDDEKKAAQEGVRVATEQYDASIKEAQEEAVKDIPEAEREGFMDELKNTTGKE